MSYRAGPAGHYREQGPWDDAMPLERQLAAERDRRSGVTRQHHVSAAYLPFDGAGPMHVLMEDGSCHEVWDTGGFGDASCIGVVPPGVLDMNAGGPEMPYDEWVKFLDTHLSPRERETMRRLEGFGALGDISAWKYLPFHTLDSGEVYVVRLKCTGLPLQDGKDLLLFVQALGLAQTLGFDIRGATAWQDPGADASSWWIDIVATVSSWEGNPFPFIGNDAASIATKIQNNTRLRAQFPSLQIDQAASLWGELTGPVQAIDFWKSQPLLWDHNLPGPKDGCAALIGGCGGPTNTFASPPASSIAKGKADDGALSSPFPVTGVVPIVADTTTQKGFALGAIHLVGAAALVGALGLGYYYYYGKKGHGR